MKYLYFFLLAAIQLFYSCHKEEKLTSDSNAKLEFSTDTIFFDTLFSSTQSITGRLKVFNNNNKAVKITSIELGGKASSAYKVIINGQTTWYQNDVTLRGGDSIYVLVSINIAEAGNNLPFLVNDSLVFNTNGNLQKVQLLAVGQDASFINGSTVPCDTTWTNKKPFVLYNKVRVAPGCTLTIEKGTKIYFHSKASLSIEGTLVVNGEKDNQVLFSGDNLSEAFEDLPGQWEGIVFESSSKNNSMNYCRVQNASKGITMYNDPSDVDVNSDLDLNNTIVMNMQLTGVEVFGRDVKATNCLFANTVRSAFSGLGGGNYNLTYCTIVNYSYDFFREDSTLSFSNNVTLTSGNVAGPLSAKLTNCIIWGDYPGELSLDDDGLNTFSLQADHCLLRTNPSAFNNNGNILNEDPLFESPVKKNYHLKVNSPAIDAAAVNSIIIDLEGNSRSGAPDIGAYEK